MQDQIVIDCNSKKTEILMSLDKKLNKMCNDIKLSQYLK